MSEVDNLPLENIEGACPEPGRPSGGAEERLSLRSFVAIGLVSCAVLIYEIAITRILSVVVWYHFAFLSLSLAMLGLGAPGVWFSLRPPGPRSLARALIVSGIAAPASVAVIFRLGPLTMDARIPVLVLCVLAPLIALGAGVCILLMQAGGKRIGRMYGADLLGAVFGAVLVMPLMYWIATPYLIALAGFLPLAAAVLTSPRRSTAAWVASGALALALLWGVPFELRYTKSYSERTAPEYERWTPTARLTVWDRPIWSRDPGRPWMWGMGSRYQRRELTQKWIEQDGSAGTPIENLTGTPDDLDHLAFDVTGVGYQLRAPASVCVIGAGGGRDILTALQAGAGRIDAVEINGAIIDLVSGPFRGFSGDVYHLDGVRPVASEGRSFLTRTDRTYDLIQIALVDSWAATAAGAFALSENYLYTVESFRLYLSRLTENGVVSVSRWFGGDHQMESARLTALVLEALRAEGVEDPASHVAIAGSSGVATFLVGRRPFRDEEIGRLDRICIERGFARLWPPSPLVPPTTITTVMTEGVERHRAAGFDLSPPVDDRPFFFQTASLVRKLDPELRGLVGENELAVSILRQVTVALLLVTLALFFLPLLLARRLVRGPRFWSGSIYFACIGVGFMFVEVPWIQRFILYLGHPSLATAAVICALLLGAGIGSMAAPRIVDRPLRRTGLVLPAVLALANVLHQPLLGGTLGWSVGLRLAVTAIVLAPIGALMGIAFPAGMIRFGDANKPWFWAVNGAFGVVGSVLSVSVSMLFGFSTVIWLAVGAYVLALAVLRGR